MQIEVTIEVWRKEKYYIAYCPEFDFISQGKTSEEARANLMEVIEIQFEEMKEIGTLEEYLKECGFEIKDKKIETIRKFIGLERNEIEVEV